MPLLTLLFGVFAGSTAVIWIKMSSVDPVILTGLRLALASLLLAPFAVRDWRRHRSDLNWTHVRDAAIPGVVLTGHLITWTIGSRMTLASNGVLVVNLTPLATPFLLAGLMGERLTRRELGATLLAAIGLVVLFLSDYQVSAESFQGDLICLGSMLLLALYLTLGRKFRHHPTNLLYVTPLYVVASLTAFATAPVLADPSEIDWLAEAPWILLLTILPTLIGHSLVNNAMRHLRGQVVSVMIMNQFVFAGLLAWALLGEVPHGAFYPAAAMIVAAVVVVATAPRGRE